MSDNNADREGPSKQPSPPEAGKIYNPPPVAGYKPQSQESIDLVNRFKMEEEHLLRTIDKMMMERYEASAINNKYDNRWLQIGRTHMEQAFMAINRGIFMPGRVTLPGDLLG